MKSIYTKYKERLIEVSGKSRSIFSRKGNTGFSFDIGEFLGSNTALFDLLWKEKLDNFSLVNKDSVMNLYLGSGVDNALQKDQKYKKLLLEDKDEAKKYANKFKNSAIKNLVRTNVNSLVKLKKEIIDVSKETGKYELYIGYPFVYGNMAGDTFIKAPLVLFPVRINVIDENNVEIDSVKEMPVMLNKALIFAYAGEKKINVDDLEMEFKGNFSSTFKNVDDVLKYLRKYRIDFGEMGKGFVSSFDSSGIPQKNSDLSIKNHCVMGRYPLANAIYNDYNELEKKKASSNEAIDELIYAKSLKNLKKIGNKQIFSIHELDYTQEKAIEKINTDGNMVIYGPPGTGKSQTIVNVISDALAKKKRVLVVSQKKAALDVVYNRLGKVKKKAMFISDPEKDRESFYKKICDDSASIDKYNYVEDVKKHSYIEELIQEKYKELEKIFSVLYVPTEFGACLETMYEMSSQISKNSFDHQIYEKLVARKDLLDIKYDDLRRSLNIIKQNKRGNLYYKYKFIKEKNMVVEHLKDDLDIYKVDNALNKVDYILNNKTIGFDTSKYPYSSYLIAYCVCTDIIKEEDLKLLVDMIAKQNNKKGVFVKSSFEKDLLKIFDSALIEIKEEIRNFDFLKNIMSEKGYQMMVGAILNGNGNMFRNLKQALSNYSLIRDIKVELSNLGEQEKKILDFALEVSDNQGKYVQALDNYMAIRMYIEIVKEEENKREELAKIMSFDSIKDEILNLKKKQNLLSQVIASNSFNDKYLSHFNNDASSKNFLYQINKQQNTWPIRKFMNSYYEFMIDLYPCWLLSPENVSTILPLVKDMFDVVLIDEASQVFIENTLPILYRGKKLVVAGDSKQLRPTSTFMKRYMGSDIEEDDPTREAALEVESLLDLATSRLPSTNLNYHYRSRNEELINFSNNYFYDGKLEVSPNLNNNKAIRRFKVDGRWVDRKNEVEAEKVVEILKKILKSRRNKESIGIITFNSEQAYAIEDAIRKESKKDSSFRDNIVSEQNRFENNEDVSLFVKNIENVQGDERDIIIMSTGYAPNESGRIIANFGSLSLDGGENRLNVAITRAKDSMFVVTSIEPEDLKVEGSKNDGPKILKKYLSYVRAVSSNNDKEVKVWLNSRKDNMESDVVSSDIIAKEIKECLEKNGYIVETNVGNTRRKVDIAVYDKDFKQYLLGIECINKEYKTIGEMVENQLYHLSFLESRGWRMYHVWTRDWWNKKNKVINSIIREIENAKKELIEEKSNSQGAKKRKL